MTWPPRPPEIPPPWRPDPTPAPDHPSPPPSPSWPIPVVPLPPTPDEELAERLLARRIVLVRGPLTVERATDAGARLMLLDADGDDPIDVHLSCAEGDLDAALGLADTIDLIGVPVRAWAVGRVGGAALAPFLAADRRLARPHALFVLRDPDVELSGRAEDVAMQVEAHHRQVGALRQRVAARCGRALERVEADFARGMVLDAAGALEYGLVDEVNRSGP